MEIKQRGNDTASISMTGEDMARMISAVDQMNDVLNRFTHGDAVSIKAAYISFYLANVSRWFHQNIKKDGQPIMSEDDWTDLFAAQAKSWLQQIPEQQTL